MPISPLVTVAGVALPEPSTYSGVVSTLVNNARNSQGVMIGAVIRDNIGKVEMTWKYLTVQQWSLINQLFSYMLVIVKQNMKISCVDFYQ